MKPVPQQAATDCLRACIATLLEYPAEEVPDFTQAPESPDCPFPAFWLSLQSWLAERGLFFFECVLTDKTPLMPLPLPALCIAMGGTAQGIRHAIVARLEEGNILPVYNPKPSAQLEGVGSLGFLVPRDPVLPVALGRSIEKIGKLVLGLPQTAVSDSIREECAKALGLDVVNGSKIIQATLADLGKLRGQN